MEEISLHALEYYFDYRRKYSNLCFYDLFSEHSDLFGQKKVHMHTNLEFVLLYKSALYYLAEDYPLLAETLLYSQFMEQLNELIDRWWRTGTRISNYDELLGTIESSEGVPRDSHTWWKLIDNIKSINGVSIEICKARDDEHMKFHNVLHASYDNLQKSYGTYKEAEDSLKLANEARFTAEIAISSSELKIVTGDQDYTITSAQAFAELEKVQNRAIVARFDLELAEVEYKEWKVQSDFDYRKYKQL